MDLTPLKVVGWLVAQGGVKAPGVVAACDGVEACEARLAVQFEPPSVEKLTLHLGEEALVEGVVVGAAYGPWGGTDTFLEAKVP